MKHFSEKSNKHKLLAALQMVLGEQFRTSGNLKNKINDLETEDLIALADGYFAKNLNDRTEVFKIGVEVGKIAKNKPIYIVLHQNKDYFAFIGSEADILRKIDDFISSVNEVDQDNP